MATTISTDSPKLTADIASRAEVYGGRGLVFDGTSDYLSVNDDGTNGNGLFDHVNVSVSFWTKIPTSGSSYPMYPLATFEGQISQFVFTMNSATQLIIQNNNSSSPISNIPTIATGVWEHWAVTREPWSGQSNADAHQFKVYRNGELIATRQQNSAWLLHKANLTIGRKGNSDSGYFNGSMCDMKIWTGYTLSLSEIQEIYKKPEQSAPSASLSYLSAWYPMSEANPESPQSIVYDHSEKGLGSELSNKDFTGWTLGGSSNWSASSATSLSHTASASGYASSPFSTSSGKLYKVSITINSGQTSTYKLQLGGSSWLYDPVDGNDTWSGSYTFYVSNAGNSSNGFKIYAPSGFVGTFTDVSVKEVLMGNHATTNFFEEQVTNGDMSGTTTMNGVGFTYYNASGATESGTIGGVADTWKVTASGADAQIRIIPNDASAVGKQYSISVKVYNPSSGGVTNIQPRYIKQDTNPVAYGSTITATDAWTTITGTMTYDGTISQPLNIATSSSSSEYFYIDDWSVKEVGISSTGFETAVNEPVIPQIPLVRYNEKMVFKGTSGQYVDVDIDSMNLGDFTISFWYNTNNSEGTFIGRGTSSCIRFSTNTTTFRVGYSNNYYINATTGSEIVNGRFLTATREGTSFKLYIDGVLDSTTTVATDAWTFGNTARIGQSGWGNFDGTIHECSVFNTALDSTEIQELFNDGIALDATAHSKSGNLLGYWRNDGISTWKNRADNFASFDGVNDVIARNAINVDYKSVSFWIKPATTFTTSSSGRQIMFFGSWDYGSITLGSATTHWDSDPEPHDELITMVDNQGSGVKHSAWIPTGGETIPNDSWTHIAFVWDGSKYVIYYNGQPQTVTPSTGHVELHTNKNIKIGTGNDGNIPLHGSIANFAMWSESLTDPQMLSVYNAGHNGDISLIQSSDLELYYTFNPYASTDPDTNSTVQDRSGNDNDSTSITGAVIDKTGTVAGTPDSITIREGLNSNKDGLGFPLTNPTSNIVRFSRNGLAEHLSIPITKAFDIQGSFTVEFWMKQPDMGSGYQQIINRDDTSNRNWSVQSINGQISLGYYSGGSFSNTQTSGTYDDDKWHHVCAILTSGTSVQIYVDTVLVKLNTSSIPTTIDNDPAVLNIGKRTGTTQFFIGSLDEVRFYNKALTAFEADGSAPEEGETATSGEVVKNYKHGKGKHKND